LSDKQQVPKVHHTPARSLRQRILAAKARISRRAALLDFAGDGLDGESKGAVRDPAIGNGESRR